MRTAIEFLLFYVIVRGIIAKYIADIIRSYLFEPFGKYLYKCLVKTDRDVAIWLHYKNKQLRKQRLK